MAPPAPGRSPNAPWLASGPSSAWSAAGRERLPQPERDGSMTTMQRPRRSSEEGHRRKFLVVIDDTPECARALHYAARRAARSGGALALLYVISPSDFQHWLGVENIMR